MTINSFENQTIIDELSSIEENKMKIKKGEIIIEKNTGPSEPYIYVLVSGEALLEIQGQSGKNFMHLITENQLFGIENLVLDGVDVINELEYTVTALTDCCFIKIEAQFFLDHVYINPFSYHAIFSDIITRYFLLAQSHQYINQSPEVKLGISLINMSSILKIKKNNYGEITFPKYITQSFVSQYVRSSEPNVSKASTSLEKINILKRNPFVIKDELKLKEMIRKNIK